MKTNRANRILRKRFDRAAHHAAGLPHSYLDFASHRRSDANITDIFRLPVAATVASDTLQRTSDGAFYWVVGYSTIGAGDILR